MKKINLEDVLTDRALEDELAEVPVKDNVFKIVFAAVVVLVLVGLFQVFNIGVLKNDFYSRRAFANMSLTVVKPAPRGIITDRFGTPLLQNEAVVNVSLDINVLPRQPTERETALNEISEALALPEATLKEMIKSYDWNRRHQMILKENIVHDELLRLSSLELPGIVLVEGLKRVYKEPLSYSHVLGYIGLVSKEDLASNPDLYVEDLIGKSGLEAYYDEYLRGVSGKEVFLKNARKGSREQIVSQKATAGNNLKTFIDGPLQEILYKRIGEEIRRLGRKSGAGIVINPQNGEVLALVSFPGFDGNNLIAFLKESSQPLFNRVVSGLYNPGSTIKPLVALAALKEGVITPEHQIYSAGYIEIPNPYNPSKPSRFLDWKPHGWVNIYSALARSSNVYFYEVGGGLPAGLGFEEQLGLGIEKLKNWWHKFGLELKTGIDLPGEASGFLPDPEWKENKTGEPWRLGDTYNVTIGQGDLLVTPLELINYVSAIANGGKLYRLRVADWHPVEVLGDLSGDLSSVLPMVRKGLEDAVKQPYGTAHSLSGLPIRVAAKTGTAQIQNNEKLNAFFVGYAPADPPAGGPQIAVLILVEDAKEGSLNAVPIAKDVFAWYYENRLKQ